MMTYILYMLNKYYKYCKMVSNLDIQNLNQYIFQLSIFSIQFLIFHINYKRSNKIHFGKHIL